MRQERQGAGCFAWLWISILFFVAVSTPNVWTWGLFLLFLASAIAAGRHPGTGGRQSRQPRRGTSGLEVVTLNLTSRPSFDRDVRALERLLASTTPPRVRILWNYRANLQSEEGVLEEVSFERLTSKHGIAHRYRVAEPRVLLSKQHASPIITTVTLAPGVILIGEVLSGPVEVRYWDDLTAEVTATLVRQAQHLTPAGADVISSGWLHVRIDGSPDRRFSDNPRADVIRYVDVRLMAGIVPVLYLRFLNESEADAFLRVIRLDAARASIEGQGRQPRSDAAGRPEPNSSRSTPGPQAPPPRQPEAPHAPRSPHEVLGVPTGADQATIRKAYIELVKQYHPDRVANLAPEIKELAGRRMREINRAYEEIGGT